MNQAPTVTQGAVAAHEHVAADCLSEHLNPQHVGEDLLRFPVKIGVDESHVVVGGDAVAQSAEALPKTNSDHKWKGGCRREAGGTSSTRWTTTESGSELRMCCSSWSVVELGRIRPLLFPTQSRPTMRQPAMLEGV